MDSDGIPDADDDDIDGDGFTNAEEGSGDTDGDGIPDDRDRDSDNDGRLDIDETSGDTDGDGVDDRVDSDSDGDGLADGVDPSDDEDNSDEAIDDPDVDGIATADDNCPFDANPLQENNYGDGPDGGGTDAEGDACDDTDGDVEPDATDGCPLDATRTRRPCEPRNDNENAACLGMAGSVDPDVVPVTFSTTGVPTGGFDGAGPPANGTAYFSPVDAAAGLFGACVPINPGDGSPWFLCNDGFEGSLPGAEIMGVSPDGVYLAVSLDGGLPGDIAIDVGACDDADRRPPHLAARPELSAVDEFARARFPFEEETINVDELVQLEPAEIAELTTDEQEELVDEALGELNADQVVAVESAVLATVPASEVLALSPEIIVLMPVDTLDSIISHHLATALDNNLSNLPTGYVQLLTVADLQVLEPEALATLEPGQLATMGAAEQQFVGEVLDGLRGEGSDGP